MKDSFLQSNTNIISKPDLRIGPGYISYLTVTLAGGMTVRQDKCALFVTELTAEIIRSFVEKIEVKRPEKVPSIRTKKQTLVIWRNFIGVVDVSQQEQKETA